MNPFLPEGEMYDFTGPINKFYIILDIIDSDDWAFEQACDKIKSRLGIPPTDKPNDAKWNCGFSFNKITNQFKFHYTNHAGRTYAKKLREIYPYNDKIRNVSTTINLES